MPRKSVVVKREALPDPKYNSKMLAKFVNVLMRKGKKSTAEAICYKALDRIQEKTKGDPIAIFKKAVENVKPTIEVKSRRVGGASYQVPVELNSLGGFHLLTVGSGFMHRKGLRNPWLKNSPGKYLTHRTIPARQ